MSPPLRPRPAPLYSQFTYPISRHTLTSPAQCYPRTSEDFPEILVYGHDSGIALHWRSRVPQSTVSDDQMQIDNATPVPNIHDEDRGAKNTLDPADFNVFYNIHLGTPVYAVSFPPAFAFTPAFDSEEEECPHTTLLAHNLLLAAACGDRTLKLITLPPSPPAPDAHPGSLESIVSLGGGVTGHRSPATQIAITFLPPPKKLLFPGQHQDELDDDEAWEDWELVVASASHDNNGLIVIWKLALVDAPEPAFVGLEKSGTPRYRPLLAPAMTLAWNPCPNSVARRQQLLVADRVATRIYSMRRQEWVAVFNTPFSKYSSLRKRSVASEWCLNGRGFVTLLEDGEWGMLDLEGIIAGGSKGPGLVLGYHAGGVVGDLLATGVMSIREADIFGKGAASIMSKTTVGKNIPHEEKLSYRGGISVLVNETRHLTDKQGEKTPDELIAIQHGSGVTVVTSMARMLNASVQKTQRRGKDEEGRQLLVELTVDAESAAVSGVSYLDLQRFAVTLGNRIAVVEKKEKEDGYYDSI